MKDLVMVAVTTAVFVLCLAYVHWCDRIIEPDPAGPGNATTSSATLMPTTASR